MIRVNLTYNELAPLPSALTFNTPSSAMMWEKVEYLYARSPDLETPIIFTSSDHAILKVELINSYWQMEYCGPGTATVTATQAGQTPIAVSVTVNEKPAPTGRIINVGTGSGSIDINMEDLELLPGDTVVIAPGVYEHIDFQDIIVPDGEAPITIYPIGLITTYNENPIGIRNLRNVIIDGCRVPGLKQAIKLEAINYRAIYWGNLNHVEIHGVHLKDIYDSAWYNDWQGNTWIYDGTESSYLQDVKFINCKSDNSGALAASGRLDVTETAKLNGLVVDFQCIGWEVINTSSGSPIYIGAAQEFVVKDCTFDHINTLNNNHNGIVFVSGTANLINNRFTNFQGNTIRNWVFSVIDEHLGTQMKTSHFYGNHIFCSRKYGAFEGQSFDRYNEAGFSTGANIYMFNNTMGNMNLNNDPTVFTGTGYDNYYLQGGTAKFWNNILINPISPSSNNICFTYNSVAIGGTEHQAGDIWEWNNRVYYSLADSRIDPVSLVPEPGQSGKSRAITNSDTVLYTEDRYGAAFNKYIGAVQSNNIILPEDLDAPTMPEIYPQRLNAWSSSDAKTFVIDCKRSTSPIGIKNYDIEVNGIVKTTRGAYCRDGKPDPSVDSYHLPWTAYTYRWRARDWRDQVSDWTEPMTFAMTPAPGETEPDNYATLPTLTKVSGGTLVNTGGVYSAADNTVIFNTGIVIPAGHAARLIIDHNVAQGVLGWATTATPATINDIKAGISTNDDGTRYEGVTEGTRIDQRDISGGQSISLFISYNGDCWCERSDDGGRTWGKPGNRLTSYFYLGTNNMGDKHIVGYIPTDRVLSHPKVILYPEPFAPNG